MDGNSTMLYLCGMARDDVQVNFRMPAALKAALDEAAQANKRSITAELVARLEASFSPGVASGSFAIPTELSSQQIEHVRLLLDAIEFIKHGYPDEKPPAKRPSLIGPYRKPESEEKPITSTGTGGGSLRANVLHAPPKRDDID